MKYLDLETFTDFVCIGSDCPFTCCGGGWTVTVDKETDQFYQSVTGEMGELLKKSISRDGDNVHFIMNESGYCPFLNEHGLCNIILNLGEEHLSNTCTYYPRYVFCSGDIRFAGVSISCPVVSRFYLTKTEPLQIDFGEDDKPVSGSDKIDWTLFNHAIRTFTSTVGIAQNRSLSINERLALIMLFLHRFQSHVDNGTDPGTVIDFFSDHAQYTQLIPQIVINESDYNSKAALFSEILGWFGSFEMLERKLPETAELVKHFSVPANASINPDRMKVAFDTVNSESNRIWCENLIVYSIYRYFMQGFEENNFFEITMRGLVLMYSVIIIDLGFYHIKSGSLPDMDHLTLLVAHLSRLVEHNAMFRNMTMDSLRKKNMLELPYLLKLVS